jgi:DNA-binding CsgD family transcriptional regulator/PAS domain-containing protein
MVSSSLTLTTADVARLQRTIGTLLSPLVHRDARSWAEASMREARALLGADQALMNVPEGAAPNGFGDGPWTAEAQRTYLEYYWQFDVGLADRRRELGLEVYHTDMIESWPEFSYTEFYNDWCVRYRMEDSIGFGIEEGRGGIPALLHLYHDNRTQRPFGERGLMLLQLVLPAFKAGMHSWRQLAGQRAALGALIDDLPLGSALCDETGRVVHLNPALTGLLAREADGDAISAGVKRMALSLAPQLARQAYGSRGDARGECCATPPYREIATTSHRYRLSASLAPADLLGVRAYAMIVVECLTPEPLDATALRERFGLTAREAEVCVQLSGGLTNVAIAQRLGVKPFTARRHTEAVLRKLGVPNRAAVGAVVRGGGVRQGDWKPSS